MRTISTKVASCIAAIGCVAGFSSWAGTEGALSTFYGQGAGLNNTGGGGLGLNTFLGVAAGHSNTSGQNNTFVGAFSGYYNVAAGNNSFFGELAGYNNVSGASNTFLGTGAGMSNITGTGNTFVGYQAGQLSDVNGNTFIGYSAGYSNTSGPGNVFVGTSAGYANTIGFGNAFFGYQAGQETTTGGNNTFIGPNAGNKNLTGGNNTYVGFFAGYSNVGGNYNVLIGNSAGYAETGSNNVFIGNGAGYAETGSHKLYIDNCACTPPLIYGEFDNHVLKLNGRTEVHYDGQPKSQLNFSQTSTDTGGYLTSVLDNNFFMSSGARFDGSLAAPNQWVQRSGDGFSVIQGSGGQGYRVFTSSGHAQDSTFFPSVRLHINYNGEFGINQAPVAGHEIHTSSGAYLASGTWTNASSRELKDNVMKLSIEEAAEALAALDPVKFNYKSDATQQRVGFIAEDVPELVAVKDRKGLSPMDIVAVLTKVVQEQQRALDELRRELTSVKAERNRDEAMR
jgi:hypothetical protein